MKTIRHFLFSLVTIFIFIGFSIPPAVQAGPAGPTIPTVSTVAQRISVDSHHACLLADDSSVKCWGYNFDGQLGTGDAYYRSIPSPVFGISGAADVATGQLFSCAMMKNGGVKCWGDNTYGELGNGTFSPSLIPVDVTGLPGPAWAITAGAAHACALVGKNAYCWGFNSSGQLGNGDPGFANQNTAVLAGSAGFMGISAITAGNGHTCAIVQGFAWCWGVGPMLGNNGSTNSALPVAVANLPAGVVQIAAGGAHTCAVTPSGGLVCWGSNSNGQLGDGSTSSRLAPVPVVGLASGVSTVAAGESKTCAIKTDNAVLCWGQNRYGDLLDGTRTDQSVPVHVIGLPGVPEQIGLGGGFSCFVILKGGVSCWGIKSNGVLGNGDPTQRESPLDVPGLASGVTGLGVGSNSACAVVNGGARCWGSNSNGQLGDGTQADHYAPVDVQGLASGVTQVSVGDSYACALVNGGLKCWGKNNLGQLGNNSTSDSPAPVDVSGMASGVSAVTAGADHACAIKTDQSLWCWGDNNSWELGNSTVNSSPVPKQLSLPNTTFISASAGSYFTCALVTVTNPPFNRIYCWGNNASGQLGRGTTSTPELPGSISAPTLTFSATSRVSAGGGYACALASDGPYCWGFNVVGQLGDDTTSNRTSPVKVVNLSLYVTRLVAGNTTTCVLTSGAAYCWGGNSMGTVGDGTTTNRLRPYPVFGLSSGVSELFSGGGTSFALMSTGAVKAWGTNNYGQLGIGNPPVCLALVWATGFTRYRSFLTMARR